MAVDKFTRVSDDVGHPARQAFAVTPHATNEVDPLPKALLIGGAGNIVLRAVDSAADVTIAVVAGQLLPIRAQFVRASGTTATGIIALA